MAGLRTAAVFLLWAHAGCAAQQPPGVSPETTAAAARQIIRTGGITAGQPFSPAVLARDVLYLSSQSGRSLSSKDQPGDIRIETRQAMERIGATLEAAGMGYPNLVKCHVYLASMDDYVGMNQTYGSFFSGRVPARTTVEVAALAHGARVEIACVAYRTLSRISVVRPPEGSLPTPLGPYSPGVWAGDTLYLSGMGGQFPEGRRLPPGFDEQVSQAVANIRTTLEAAGLGPSDVVSGEAYLTGPQDADRFPAVYMPAFAAAPHPRMLVLVPRLPGSIQVEITAIATRRSGDRPTPAPARPGDGVVPYVFAGDVLYTRAESAEEAGPGFEQQYRGVLHRQEATLRASGLGWADVAKVQVYLSDLADLEPLDRIFRERFPTNPPARTAIQVVARGAQRVQSSLVAVRSDRTR